MCKAVNELFADEIQELKNEVKVEVNSLPSWTAESAIRKTDVLDQRSITPNLTPILTS